MAVFCELKAENFTSGKIINLTENTHTHAHLCDFLGVNVKNAVVRRRRGPTRDGDAAFDGASTVESPASAAAVGAVEDLRAEVQHGLHELEVVVLGLQVDPLGEGYQTCVDY